MTYYSQENHGPYAMYDLGDFALASGETLAGGQLAYATLGTLNAAKDNAILITTWWSGTSKIMETTYTGAGRAIDPAKYFVIIANQLGSGVSTSPNNAPASQAKSKFPRLDISDDVRAQERLISEKFGVKQLALAFGGSMGAQQCFEWAVRFPDRVKRIAALAGTARCSDHSRLFGQTLREAMSSDANFKHGDYKDSAEIAEGLKRVATLMSVSGWCPEFYRHEVWKGLGFASVPEFKTNFMEGYFAPMDPNVLIAEVMKWQAHDVSRTHGGDLAKALGAIKAKTLIMQIENDLMFPLADCEADHKMIPGSQLRVIKGHSGHLGLFAIEANYSPQFDKYLGELLAA